MVTNRVLEGECDGEGSEKPESSTKHEEDEESPLSARRYVCVRFVAEQGDAKVGVAKKVNESEGGANKEDGEFFGQVGLRRQAKRIVRSGSSCLKRDRWAYHVNHLAIFHPLASMSGHHLR